MRDSIPHQRGSRNKLAEGVLVGGQLNEQTTVKDKILKTVARVSPSGMRSSLDHKSLREELASTTVAIIAPSSPIWNIEVKDDVLRASFIVERLLANKRSRTIYRHAKNSSGKVKSLIDSFSQWGFPFLCAQNWIGTIR